MSVFRKPIQTRVEATSGIMIGMYTSVRSGPRKASLGLLSRRANPRLAIIVTGIEIRANRKVAPNDRATIGSLSIRV